MGNWRQLQDLKKNRLERQKKESLEQQTKMDDLKEKIQKVINQLEIIEKTIKQVRKNLLEIRGM